MCLQDHRPEGVRFNGTARMHEAEVTDFHEAIGQDMLEEAAHKFDGVETGGALPGTARLTVREGDGALLERNDAVVGNGDLENVRGEIFTCAMSVGLGPTVDVPGGVPDLRVDVFEHAGLFHLLLEDSTVDGRESFNGDKEVVSGREPLGAFFGETTAWDDGVDVRVVLELPTPGMEDRSKAGQLCSNEALIFGQPFEGMRRGLEHRRIGQALMRADKRPQRLRDGEGDEEVGAGELFLQLLMQPLPGFMVLTLRTVAVTT